MMSGDDFYEDDSASDVFDGEFDRIDIERSIEASAPQRPATPGQGETPER